VPDDFSHGETATTKIVAITFLTHVIAMTESATIYRILSHSQSHT
jgi:hypothetical protein